MDGVNTVQVKDAAAVRKAARGDTEFVLADGDELLFRCIPVAASLKRLEHYLTHYPHEVSECLGTCWRHDGSVDVQAETDDAPQPEPEPAPVP